MSAAVITAPRRRPAFGKIVINEARLAWRQPAGLLVGIGIPVVLLVIFGVIPAFQQSSPKFGGASAFDIYIPILISFTIGVLALVYLPGPLVTYREQGILRRLSTTPARPSWVLAAQLVVQTSLMVAGIGVLIILSIAVFGVTAPVNLLGVVLSLAAGIAAMFALGLAIAAVAKTSAAARGIMAGLFYPLNFLAGLYVPLEFFPKTVQDIGHYSPLGAVVESVGNAWIGNFHPVGSLLALVGYAVVFGFIAVRYFRWE